MARPKNRKPAAGPAAPLQRQRLRLGPIDVAGVARDLHGIFEASDHEASLLPDPSDILALLLYTERHATQLPRSSRGSAARLRVLLWQWLREQCDRHQYRAVSDARDAGTEWAELVYPLAVNSITGAHNKARRMLTETLADTAGPVRRTPEAATKALADLAAVERQQRHRAQVEAGRLHQVTDIARQLVEHRDDLAVDDEEWVPYWLDQVEYAVANCRTDTQRMALATYVCAVARHLRQHARHSGEPFARTPEAVAAVELAVQLEVDGSTALPST